MRLVKKILKTQLSRSRTRKNSQRVPVQDFFGGTGTINRMNQTKKTELLRSSHSSISFSRLEDETRDFPESPKNVENGQ